MASQSHVDYLFKILLLGDSSVGKSSLLLRFSDDTFKENQVSTIGVDWKIRTVDLDGKRIKLQLWDSAGQERFRTIASSYYRGAHGVAVVFDLTSEKSFSNVDSWLEEVGNHATDNIPKVLLGNKLDLPGEREIATEKAKQYADSNGMKYLETSAKNADNVTEAFLTMTREIYENIGTSAIETKPVDTSITLTASNTKQVKQKDGCC